MADAKREIAETEADLYVAVHGAILAAEERTALHDRIYDSVYASLVTFERMSEKPRPVPSAN
ncbi:MAG TPA: hypothetical protein VGK45_14565 [Thermoanaerobaculia bacterium]